MKQIVYISNPESQNIETWNLYENGKMELIDKINTNGQVQPIKIIKNSFLYAGIRPNNRIITYFIKNNGFLVKKGESTLPASPNYISFDSKKKFLFCSSYHGNCMSVSSLNKDNIPQDPMQVIYNIQGCHAAQFNDKYNVLFITSLKKDRIYLYYLTDHGILKSTEQKFASSLNKSGPRHIIFHPKKDFSYTINELNGTIDVWNIYTKNNIFKVKNIQNSKILGNLILKKYWSSDIHLTSCGKFLYVSDRFFNSISLFHVNKINNTIIFYKMYKTEEQPRAFYIDKNDNYLISAGQKSNFFSIYNICKKTGELKYLNRYSTSKGPLWITSCII
ncbi:6-phosphogluconolactonase [Buchnera aphidicola (Melanaphis sacchari)]|uniref:6-phosphogluconolactonase n=1 Tax=Buchnera aphidicola (Melanaphis sacchari) TaxID=2173854 RepID=A0A2U8DFB2_9GAMM|nr:6-phosphogluconolactonase [Buchnera aphidicola]AWH90496.1 6-phosphogluconolactonase [Buchnera aphidicola (Melanaphis sacchari)]